jgi:hypothetical protein
VLQHVDVHCLCRLHVVLSSHSWFAVAQTHPVPYSLSNGDSLHGAAPKTVRATASAAAPAQGAFDMFAAQAQAEVSWYFRCAGSLGPVVRHLSQVGTARNKPD